MTEDEAKACWCPFARVATQTVKDYYGGEGPAGPVANRWTSGARTGMPRLAHCIASACMAWRWVGSHVTDPDNPKGDLIWSGRTYGHCGLAGDVEPTKASSLEYRRAHPDPTPPNAA